MWKSTKLFQSTKTVQIVGINNDPQEYLLSEPISFLFMPFEWYTCFLRSFSATIYLFGQDFLEKYVLEFLHFKRAK